MSLHNLASQLQSAGRGEDKVLVHMTPKEVGGLQSLAMAHGGSLTINPETGLPEAGFLSSILPMIAGFALGPAGFGLMSSALGAGALVGGITGVATGSLKKGLMAGLGAYGGSSLGEGLSAAGSATTHTVTPAATNATTQLAPVTPVTPPVAEMYAVPPQANLTTPGVFSNPNYSAYVPTPAVPPAVPTPQGVFSNPNLTAYNPSPASATSAPTGPSTTTRPATGLERLQSGAKESFGSMDGLKGLSERMTQQNPYSQAALGVTALDAARGNPKMPEKDKALIRPYDFSYNRTDVEQDPYSGSAERTYFNPTFTAREPYEAPGPEYMAVGGAVEDMSAQNSLSGNMMYPQANLQTDMYSNPAMQRPMANNVISAGIDAPVDPYSGEARFAEGGKTDGKYWSGTAYIDSNPKAKGAANTSQSNKYNYDPQTMQFSQLGANKVSGGIASPIMQPQAPAQPMMQPVNIPAYQSPEQQLGLGGFYEHMNQQLGQMGGYQGYAAGGGISHLGSYSDGGRLLRGPGDGVSDSIPAQIGEKQPARLADGEFVVPARIVSEIGNGSTEAGARKLYAMMDRVQKARGKTTGKNRVAVDSRADKFLPA